MRFISPVQQASLTLQSWNNDKVLIEDDRQYFSDECIKSLKKYVENAMRTTDLTGGPPIGIIVGVVSAFAMLVVIGVIGYMVYQKKGKSASDGGSNNSSQGAPA
ncbi:hypothetical protein E1301_Tti018865 [Triplophysa tibetana]|uniref:Uncharacterized protein n=1 Tax=Triplophysa tibetana TaxID=1572043 RepID=A0A5A9NLB9_9TELE|nr:hypothetical protein E1301_Tti018865 [Triplophysa tibetana]